MRFCFNCVALGLLAVAGLAAPLDYGQVRLSVRTDSSGRLVRTLVSTRTADQKGRPAPEALKQLVDRIALQHQVEPGLVHSVIRAESNYNPHAISPKGALGMMQLIPATARRFGVANVFDPAQNVQGGVRYLRHLLQLYKGDHKLALAAYNAGEGAVARFGGVPPYPETLGYVKSVNGDLTGRRQNVPQAVSAGEPARDPDAPNSIGAIIDAEGRIRYVTR
jgi:soluble lytic murein transglycosylase-like protein